MDDKQLWESTFPELLEGIQPFSCNQDLPVANVDTNKITYLESVEAANNIALAFIEDLKIIILWPIYVGHDCEWNWGSNITSTLQLSYPELPVLVVHLHSMLHCPSQLKTLLAMKSFCCMWLNDWKWSYMSSWFGCHCSASPRAVRIGTETWHRFTHWAFRSLSVISKLGHKSHCLLHCFSIVQQMHMSPAGLPKKLLP